MFRPEGNALTGLRPEKKCPDTRRPVSRCRANCVRTHDAVASCVRTHGALAYGVRMHRTTACCVRIHIACAFPVGSGMCPARVRPEHPECLVRPNAACASGRRFFFLMTVTLAVKVPNIAANTQVAFANTQRVPDIVTQSSSILYIYSMYIYICYYTLRVSSKSTQHHTHHGDYHMQ